MPSSSFVFIFRKSCYIERHRIDEHQSDRKNQSENIARKEKAKVKRQKKNLFFISWVKVKYQESRKIYLIELIRACILRDQ